MLQVRAVHVNEVPQDPVNLAIRPLEPILDGGLHIKHGPAVKLCRVHLAHLILSAMLATIDGGDDQRLRVQVPAVDLAAIRQLKEALTDFHRCPVHFIEEQYHRLLAGSHEPVWGVPRGTLATVDRSLSGVGQTQKIALCHL